MKFFKISLSILLVASLTACLSVKEQNDQDQDRIMNKVSFYLQCDKSDLQLQCINQNLVNDKVCSEYGVVGCGTKAIYTNIGKTWIMTASKAL